MTCFGNVGEMQIRSARAAQGGFVERGPSVSGEFPTTTSFGIGPPPATSFSGSMSPSTTSSVGSLPATNFSGSRSPFTTGSSGYGWLHRPLPDARALNQRARNVPLRWRASSTSRRTCTPCCSRAWTTTYYWATRCPPSCSARTRARGSRSDSHPRPCRRGGDGRRRREGQAASAPTEASTSPRRALSDEVAAVYRRLSTGEGQGLPRFSPHWVDNDATGFAWGCSPSE
ncbi:hypothetical protein PF005_g13979 [Phytophthora fragariae]|uniref:Uncharacterized protein n=1 Tax=Phytophthora fragariae TaxID=53985 RepID=A0A6A3XL70_9STRA|nr:hypothetical protein PF007_g15050 [Phytophthora fragariae]KAE9203948.1 hypothetical protein PF005_g13979 [Phytophthora fragariae]